jgi:hypothetical protein
MSIKEYNKRHNLYFFEFDQTNDIFLANPNKEYYTPWIYTYELNKYNFRSIDFHEKTEMVTLGCSHTFGVGLPKEYIWPSFISKITGIKDVVNLGQSGSSIAYQVRLLANYINKYGPPKIVLCNFPDLNRYEHVDDNGNIRMGNCVDANFEDFSKSPSFSYFQNYQSLNFLEALCKAGKTKLVWQFWQGLSNTENNLDLILLNNKKFFSKCVPLMNENGWSPDHNIIYNKNTNRLELFGSELKAECCKDIFDLNKDCFHYAYDRYKVKKKYIKQLVSKEIFESTLSKTVYENIAHNAHLGSHAHWHWANNLAKEL